MQYAGPHHYGADWNGAWMGRPHAGPSARARLLFPVIFSLIVQVPTSFFVVHNRYPEAIQLGTPQFWLGLALALVGPLTLLAARRFPGPVVVIVTVAAGLDLFLVPPDESPIYISLGFAIISAVARGARVWAWVSVAAGWVISLTVSLFTSVTWSPARIALITLGILIVFGVAEATRTRRERYIQIARYRAEVAEQALRGASPA
jgi:hypothetical protein